MATGNYRMLINKGMSGTADNASGLQLTYDDDISSEVVFEAYFPTLPGLPMQEVTIRESDGGITVDRSGETIDIPLPVSVFSEIYTDSSGRRVGDLKVYSEDLPNTRRVLLTGQVNIIGGDLNGSR